MKSPYEGLPDFSYWRRSVAELEVVDPVTDENLKIGRHDRIATAGSCFAQNIARTLAKEGYGYLVTEVGQDESYGVFPARFGNIYTVRHLLQLFRRAYGVFWPVDEAWTDRSGKIVDPFRPTVQKDGFGSVAKLVADRTAHLRAVREMFESCDVFVFTLGLTEGWVSTRDGAVFPVPPGHVCDLPEGAPYRFMNFPVHTMVSDLTLFIVALRRVNPGVRIVLTVSPVPLVATYEPRHVLVSTVYSKSALRVVADLVCNKCEGVIYFPSYEMITGPQARGRYFADNLRDVTAEGVEMVMSIFKHHYLVECDELPERPAKKMTLGAPRKFEPLPEIFCDERLLDG